MSAIEAGFVAVHAEEGVVAELSALAATHPFATAGFFESKRAIGCAAWILGIRDDTGRLERGCGAFIKSGRLDRTLEIASLPAVRADSPFWNGLRRFCLQRGVTKLELGTFGSPPGVEIPVIGTHCAVRSRCEFVLDLAGDLTARLSTNHRRNIKKAHNAGLKVNRTRSHQAASVHEALMNNSMQRRRSRGENVTPAGPSPENLALLHSGAGELFQAVLDANVVSSMLVLRAPKGGYYHSAGTSAEGMAVGASHFLIHRIAHQLRTEDAQIFNLGGADENSSLERFKQGFGPSRVQLPSASCYVGPSWRYSVGQAIVLARSGRQAFPRPFNNRVSRMIVYAIDTRTARHADSRAGMEVRPLTPEELRALSGGDASFRARQLDRLHRFGASYAYAVFVGDQIAHVSWLLPQAAMRRDPPRVLPARPSEAEITCCETLPEFRGRGIYGIAIGSLVDVARAQGIRRVLMKTAAENKASQSGIEKAGLKRIGSALLITVPLTQRLLIWRRFG